MICAAPWPERAWMEMLPISLYVGTALLKVPSPSIPFNFPVMIAQTELLNGPWVRFSIPDDHPRSWKGPEMPETPPETPKVTRKTARSEEHTSELQSLMRISYAVFCLKKKKKQITTTKK